ncbi:hypothetical protein [Streptomyces sp. NPDC058252]|uniref:hypothetical protein n=1 Tax=Streptomyces sp. NPDC058252 TaxID=3346405 RepID=UPI0036E3B6CB
MQEYEYPEVLDNLAEQLADHGWAVIERSPWNRAWGTRARAVFRRGAFTLLVSARPSKPSDGSYLRWRGRNRLYYGAAGTDEPWRKFPNPTAFLDFARTQNVEFLRAQSPVGSPLLDGRPRPLCSCGKESFGTERHADDWIAEATRQRVQGKQHRREARAYPCPGHPDVWHTTSQVEWSPRLPQSPNSPNSQPL